MLGVVIRVGDIELWRACTVNPLIEKLLEVGMIGFVDGFDEIGGGYVLAALDFEGMGAPAVKTTFANFSAKAVQHQAAPPVSAVVKFAGVLKTAAHDWP